MKAIVLNEDRLSLEERTNPKLMQGEVKVRIRAVGFNPVDWKMRDQWFGKPVSDILGSDASGVVEEIGEGVTGFSIGDKVYAMTMACCSNGSYAELISIPQEILEKAPSNISFETAAAIPLAAMTAYRMTFPIIKEGDSVLIAGAGGGVGSYVVQLAKLAGAKEIFSLAKDEKSRNDLNQRLDIPMENILVYGGLSIEKQQEKLLSLHGNKPFDIALDLVGVPTSFLCFNLTKQNGHFATIVSFDESFPENKCSVHKIFVAQELQNPDKKTWNIYKEQMHAITELLENGKLQPPPIENLGTLSVETVDKALSLLRSGRTKGKLVMSVP